MPSKQNAFVPSMVFKLYSIYFLSKPKKFDFKIKEHELGRGTQSLWEKLEMHTLLVSRIQLQKLTY